MNNVHDESSVMTLQEVIERLEHFDGQTTIFAQKVSGDYLPTSPAKVLWLSDEELEMKTSDVAARRCPGMTYVLEVHIAKEAIDVWSQWRGGRTPTAYQALHAVLHYSKYDAYLPVESD
jgi:hypothetical protein